MGQIFTLKMPWISDLLFQEDGSFFRSLPGLKKQSKILLTKGEKEENNILNLMHYYEMDTIIIHVLDMWKLRSKETKLCIQGHNQ